MSDTEIKTIAIPRFARDSKQVIAVIKMAKSGSSYNEIGDQLGIKNLQTKVSTIRKIAKNIKLARTRHEFDQCIFLNKVLPSYVQSNKDTMGRDDFEIMKAAVIDDMPGMKKYFES